MAKLFFPPGTISKMASISVSENDVYDVYNNGEHSKTNDGGNMAVKKYSSWGYEIGIYYKTDKYNSDTYVITAVWKRERR